MHIIFLSYLPLMRSILTQLPKIKDVIVESFTKIMMAGPQVSSSRSPIELPLTAASFSFLRKLASFLTFFYLILSSLLVVVIRSVKTLISILFFFTQFHARSFFLNFFFVVIQTLSCIRGRNGYLNSGDYNTCKKTLYIIRTK